MGDSGDWKHSRVCWCKINNEPKYVRNDIREYIGSKDTEDGRRYKWFDRDDDSFTETHLFTAKAKIIVEVDDSFQLKARSSKEAVDKAKEMAVERNTSASSDENVRGVDFIHVKKVVL
jgi:hypothetical protein